MRRWIPLLLLALFALPVLATRPGEPGYKLPWNREPTGWQADLAPRGEAGPRFVMSGRVIAFDDSTPAAGITMYAYHADSEGYYWRPGDVPDINRIGGVLRTGSRGEYRIRSVLPAQYEGPPHIHLEVWGKNLPRRGLGVNLFPHSDMPPVPMWKDVKSGRRGSDRIGIVTRDSNGVYQCHYDLRLAAMYPIGARYDSLLRYLKNRFGRNWDYRYCWMRDSSLTMESLLGLSYEEEGQAFLAWMLSATRLTWPELQVVYDVFGETRLHERTLDHLEGYAGSRPVRVGNDAVRQHQLDVYGEVVEAALHYAVRGQGNRPSPGITLVAHVAYGAVLGAFYRLAGQP